MKDKKGGDVQPQKPLTEKVKVKKGKVINPADELERALENTRMYKLNGRLMVGFPVNLSKT